MGIRNCSDAKHEDYFNAIMYDTKRTVEECRIGKNRRFNDNNKNK